jgi:hypothetical protein
MARNQVPLVPILKLGDLVKIRALEGRTGRITELRGPLGPGGASVYRVLVARKPRASYIELLGDQLEFVSTSGTVVHKTQSKPKAATEASKAIKGS